MKEVIILAIGIGLGAYIMRIKYKNQEEFEEKVAEEVAARRKAETAADRAATA
jgi:hypothetical protein